MRGFIRAGVVAEGDLCASVRSPEREAAISAMGVRTFPDARHGGAEAVAANSDIVFLAVRATLPHLFLLSPLMHWMKYYQKKIHSRRHNLWI